MYCCNVADIFGLFLLGAASPRARAQEGRRDYWTGRGGGDKKRLRCKMAVGLKIPWDGGGMGEESGFTAMVAMWFCFCFFK